MDIEPLRLAIDPLVDDPFDINLIRSHCNIDPQPDTEIDTLLLTYMKAAILWAEGEMHRTIIARSHQWVLRCFPYTRYGEIHLPRGKTQSVESIVYKVNGSATTLVGLNASPPGTDFQQDLRGDSGGVLMPPLAGSWPSADLNVPDPVVITFTAGYDAAEVPEDILHALWFYVSDAYELKGTDDIEKGRYLDIRYAKISGYMLHRW